MPNCEPILKFNEGSACYTFFYFHHKHVGLYGNVQDLEHINSSKILVNKFKHCKLFKIPTHTLRLMFFLLSHK